MLVVHHLQISQSERIVWLCEELGIEYELKTYKREKASLLAPAALKALHPSQAAPVIQDGFITLAESNACADYILAKYPNGKLVVPPSASNYADYLYWFNFANGTLAPAASLTMYLRFAQLPPDHPISGMAHGRLKKNLSILEHRLGESKWLAGEEFTAADCMVVWNLTNARYYANYSLGEYPKILEYLKRVAEREGYKRAIKKGDPDLEPVLGAEPPKPLSPGDSRL
ncbi:putative glutathione S-transferase [Tothia fuscella]|uniref:glutathione transferase n=1 Tax=Tothia fuscella TaxID=1048955 RepID=A0A9P4TSE4_9PEZI|nr:putative glutathione S-transferase [Tothia fuscella]